jgi:hypothetical protein
METVIATVKRIYDVVERPSKNGGDPFRTQKVLIEFNETAEYPSRVVLEQGGNKAMQVVETLKEGERYEFFLNYRANEWTDPKTNIPTAFGSISAWRAEPQSTETSVGSSDWGGGSQPTETSVGSSDLPF